MRIGLMGRGYARVPMEELSSPEFHTVPGFDPARPAALTELPPGPSRSSRPNSAGSLSSRRAPRASLSGGSTTGFLSAGTLNAAALTGLYAAMNTAMSVLQNGNPPVSIAIATNNTDFLPLLMGDFFKSAARNRQMMLEGTMYLKLVGAGILESFMLAAEKRPDAMGLKVEGGLRFAATTLGWSALSALLMDTASKWIERAIQGSRLLYNDPSHPPPDQACQHVCNLDYIFSQTRLILGAGAEPRSPERSDPAFRDRRTGISLLSLGGYTLLNLGMASLQRDNPVVAINVMTDLVTYGSKTLGDGLKCYRQDTALDLDRSMYIKIVSAAVCKGLMLAAHRHAVAMGLTHPDLAVRMMRVLAWALASSFLTGVLSHSIQRAKDGRSLIYRDASSRQLEEPTAYLTNLDYLAAQFGSLVRQTVRPDPQDAAEAEV